MRKSSLANRTEQFHLFLNSSLDCLEARCEELSGVEALALLILASFNVATGSFLECQLALCVYIDLCNAQRDCLLDHVSRNACAAMKHQGHITGKIYDRDAHHAVAAKVAEKSAVLLKNEEKILPLNKTQKVAVIGDFARNPRYQGAGSSKINPTKLDCGLDALKAIGANVAGFAPGFRRGGKMDDLLIRQACNLAKDSEVVLLWLQKWQKRAPYC